ncbi:MAG: HAD-IIIC family phosphatase [Planctomycetaceae bacterium]
MNRLCLISDFTCDSLGNLLANDRDYPSLDVKCAPFDRVIPSMMSLAEGTGDEPAPDAILVWTRPEAVIGQYQLLIGGEPVDSEALLAEVERFAAQLCGVAAKGIQVLVASWTRPLHQRGLGLSDWDARTGSAFMLSNMNLHLAQSLDSAQGVHMLDAGRWIFPVGIRGSNIKRWYLAKVLYSTEVLQNAVREVKAALATVLQGPRKLIVVDLDNTLWGGVVGDDGKENLVLGGHDPTGEAFVDFQRHLMALHKRGIMLAVASKNESSVALDAIDTHPEMILRREHFLAWRIDWGDKARNIRELVKSLNLGLQSCVFLDDNAFERARVREVLPEVLVPELPESPMLRPSFLESLTCFDSAKLTSEDRERHSMYVAKGAREQAMSQADDLASWLASLELTVEASPISDVNRARAVQLLNKTNQMNLTTRRLSESAFTAWLKEGDRTCWTFRIRDRFGNSGLTALASLEMLDKQVRLVDFVVSCRVFERGVEEAMLHWIARKSGSAGSLRATYRPTEKNRPCLRFWQDRSGFRDETAGEEDDISFIWDLSEPYPCPSHLKVLDGSSLPTDGAGDPELPAKET